MQKIAAALAASIAVGVCVAVVPSAAAAPPVGTVLSESAIPARNLPSGAARGVKVLYATRDQRGRFARSTGAVYYPAGQPPAGGWQVVSWAHGTAGISAPCAPSGSTGAVHDRDQPDIAGALRRGYVVTATDYIGLGGGGAAEYLGGRSAAYNVIDMVRAARKLDATVGRRWVSLGHSQGGHAALWAARTAPRDAPELPMLGTVALAPASQVDVIMPSLLRPGVPKVGSFNGIYGFGLYILSGMNRARPDIAPLSYLTPTGRQWLATARTTCVKQLIAAIGTATPGTFFNRPVDDPRFTAALRDYAGIPSSGFAAPVRIEQGTADTIVNYPGTLALVEQLRSGGTEVTLRTYPGGHMDVTRNSMADTFAAVARYFR